MALLIYLTHSQVDIDPHVPVPSWGLSEIGKLRAKAAAQLPTLRSVKSIFSSTERKAIEMAEIIAAPLGVRVEVRNGLHENDRSSTGFIPPAEFEIVADQFFAEPDSSVRGWERAADAQARIMGSVAAVLREAPSGDVLVTGHGGVGTLLYCALSALPISRAFDQPAGGGNYFTVDLATMKPLHHWKSCSAP